MTNRTRIGRCISAQLAARQAAMYGMRHDGGAAWCGDWQERAASHAYRARLMLTMLLHGVGAADAAMRLARD